MVFCICSRPVLAHHVVSLRHEIPDAMGLGADIGQTLELGASVVNDDSDIRSEPLASYMLCPVGEGERCGAHKTT